MTRCPLDCTVLVVFCHSIGKVVLNMNNFKGFLENSTIHGLFFIGTTTGIRKVVWMTAVMAGFMGAAVLISMSFQSWADSPIITNIETLSLAKIKLPKVH